jgi:hypothetical protein
VTIALLGNEASPSAPDMMVRDERGEMCMYMHISLCMHMHISH